MSFSFEVKNELINAPRNFDGAHHAFSYGVFLFAGAFRKGLMYLRTENTRVAELYAELAESMAKNEKDAKRKAELLQIAKNTAEHNEQGNKIEYKWKNKEKGV